MTKDLFGNELIDNAERPRKSFDDKESALHHFSALLWEGDQWVMLLNSFTKADLATGWFRLAKEFFLANVDKSWHNINAADIVQFMRVRGQLSKADMAALAFAVLRNREIFTDFFQYLNDDTRKILEYLTWNHKTSVSVLMKQLDVTILDYRELPVPDMKLFKGERGYSYSYRLTDIDKMLFSIPVPMRHILAEYFDKPEGYYIKPLDTIDFPSQVQLFSAEQSIFEEMPRLLAHHQQGNTKYSARGKPNLASVKRLAKTLNINEFYQSGDAFPTRTNMLLGLLHAFKIKKMPLEEQLKVLFQEHFVWEYGKAGNTFKTHAPLYVFNFLKGTGSLDVYHINGAFNRYLVELLKKIPAGSWVTQANYSRHLAYNAIPIFPFTYEGAHKLYFKLQHQYSDLESREPINEVNSQQLVNLPYLKGLIFVLAALGMVEIAFRPVNFSEKFSEQWFSEFDGLEAFRVTRLGAYILGNTPRYEQKIEVAENRFFFDDAALILRVEGDLTLIDVLMSRFLERIAPNRYAFNTALFLEDCANAADIRKKIKAFQQAIDMPLPPLWEKQLNVLRANAEKMQSSHDWEVFHLSPDDKTLQRLVAQDEVLKRITLKAERFHILVKCNDVKLFKHRLRQLGYLCE